MNIITNELILNRTQELYKYCKSELTLNNPEYLNKQKMGLWLGNTPEKISLYKVNGDKLILPFGEIDNIWDMIKYEKYKTELADVPICVESNNSIEFYNYQKEAVEVMVKVKNGILVSPAGSGKTTIGCEIIKRIGQKTLWVTHTKDLLLQAKRRFKENYKNVSVGEISGGKIDIQDVTFATVQTLNKINMASLKNEFGLVIIDECHRVAGSPTKLTMFYEVINSLACRYKIGLTATPHRADGLIRACYALLGNVKHEVDTGKVGDKTIKATILPLYTCCDVEYMGNSYNADGTIKYTSMVTELSENDSRNEIIENLIKDNEGKNILVLSDRLEHLAKINKNLGFGVLVSGKTPKKKREKMLDDMRDGVERVLFASYSLAKEGLDIPRLGVLILATPKKDKAVIIQSVGRIERKFNGKDTAIVHDLIDDVGICQNMYKHRRRIYKKNNNIVIE